MAVDMSGAVLGIANSLGAVDAAVVAIEPFVNQTVPRGAVALRERIAAAKGSAMELRGKLLRVDPEPPPSPPDQDGLPKAKETLTVGDYRSLADAVSKLKAGTHVECADGTYSGRSLTIRSPGTEADPVVIKARNRLKAKLEFDLTLAGTRLRLHGLDLSRGADDYASGDSVAMATASRGMTVDRCRIFRRVGTLVLPLGHGHKVMYCDLSVWGAQEVPKRGSQLLGNGTVFRGIHDEGKASSDITVGHNHFHDCPLKNPASYHWYKVTGVSCGINPTDWDKIGKWTIEYNLFDKTGLFDITIKTSDNDVIGNTIVGTGQNKNYFNFRSGNNNRLLSNYTREGQYGHSAMVHGGFHEIAGNDFHQPIALKWGNFDYDEEPSGGTRLHRAVQCMLWKNKAVVEDGHRYSGEHGTARMAPLKNRIAEFVGQKVEDMGGLDRVLDFRPPYDVPMAVRLRPEDVGPNAKRVAA